MAWLCFRGRRSANYRTVETRHPYSDYTRKPMAGRQLNAMESVNMPLYPKSAGGILNSSTKKAIMWKKKMKKNNIIVFGSDMIMTNKISMNMAWKIDIYLSLEQ